MSEAGYLERQGFNTEIPLAELTHPLAVERVAERAYYRAVLSDSTRHGVDRNAGVSVISNAVRNHGRFDSSDFEEIDKRVAELIKKRRA